MKKNNFSISIITLSAIIIMISTSFINAQGIKKTEEWLNVGSYHNWYSSIGAERETDHADIGSRQLLGMQWPAFYPSQDVQAAKGLWIGCRNYSEPESNDFYDSKVVHLGPRKVTGSLGLTCPH